ncbi:hypothetical protein XELAEV_18047008mg [Xenopus laevis]|uniref:RanBP2-type domain-containing protein n=1 Tax=Xenopus laevis TaxID=8355 RepID=A0A974BUK8_XENLA|nr:hypothetical protein XELAEV_18047008mg [Xenopus laevis]
MALQAITVVYYYWNEWPLLAIFPSFLKYPWIEEMEKWKLCPEAITIVENKTNVGRMSACKVTVLGYGLLTTDAQMLIDALYKQHFRVVLVDESHYMKSRNASRSKLLLPIVQKATRELLLTRVCRTPALGRTEESSIEEWEKLMRCPDAVATESSKPFTQIMGRITRIACTKAAIESKARYIQIDGNVPSAERIHLVHQFQNDPETSVAILSIQAAGQAGFEKEKQHDIHKFFSPKPDAGKKHKRFLDDGTNEQKEEECDPEHKMKSCSGKSSALYSSPRARGLSEDASMTPPKPPMSEKNWDCIACTYTNNTLLPYCEICDSPRSKHENNKLEAHPGGTATTTEPEHCENSVCFPVYDGLMFCASKHTDRIYLYSKAMHCNFIPLNIRLVSWDDLPEALQKKQIFVMYLTKEDVAAASLSKVQSSGGSVSLICRDSASSIKGQVCSAAAAEPPATCPQGLENTWTAQLPLDQVNELIQNPTEEQFWRVDHITLVYGGGG